MIDDQQNNATNNNNNNNNFIAFTMPEQDQQQQQVNFQNDKLEFLTTNYELNDQTAAATATNSATDNHSLNFGGSFDNIEAPQLRHRGQVGGYLDKYGFGWLLDQNDTEIDKEDSAPILEELDINLSEIKYKIKCVIIPVSNPNLNRSILRDNPDFWGPLLIVLAFALVSVYGQFKVVSWIITIWIFGSLFVFVIARVLGGEVNYSQVIGTIGYSLIPLLFTGSLLIFFKKYHYLGLLLKGIGVLWSTYSAATLLCVEELQHKKPLLLYPIFLLYIYFLSLYSGV